MGCLRFTIPVLVFRVIQWDDKVKNNLSMGEGGRARHFLTVSEGSSLRLLDS